MKTSLRVYILAVLLLAGVAPLANGQTLAEVLSAVQRRRQLQIDQANVIIGFDNQISAADGSSYVTPPTTLSLIDWGLGADYPTDAQVNGLPVENQISLLKQAWQAGYYNLYLGRLGGPITIANFQTAIRYLASMVRNDNKISWPVLGYQTSYDYHADSLAAFPNPPLSLSSASPSDKPPSLSIGGLSTSGGYATNVTIDLFGEYSKPPEPAALTPSDYDDDNNFSWGGSIAYLSNVTANAAPSFPGHLQVYQSAAYSINAVTGFTLPAGSTGDGTPNAAYEPGPVLFADSGPVTKGATGLDFDDFDSSFSDLSTPSYPGSWYFDSTTDPDFYGGYYLPQYQNQSSQLTQNAYFDWAYGLNVLLFTAYFLPDYGQEFASQAQPAPEELPPLQITPDFANGRIVARLGNTPENDCELEWIPNSYSDHQTSTGPSLSTRHALIVHGGGQADAVYSGSSGDREPELMWQGNEQTKNKRWATFQDYMNEWWQPVLTQLKTNTYGLDIKQQDQYTYEIDFYLASQMGAKSSTTGRYTPSGTALAKWTVKNPSSDDTDTGDVTITTDNAIYKVSMTPSTASGGTSSTQWSLAETDKSTSSPLYSVTATITSQYDSVHQTDTVTSVQSVSFDGQAPPIQTTTTYWQTGYSPDQPLYVDTITEQSADGERDTSCSYEWVTDSYGNIYLGHLTGITQTGGPNPYSATYDTNELLTDYTSGPTEVQLAYNGATVTRTELFNGQTVRVLTTTYSGGLATATTVSGVGGAATASNQFYPGSDPVYPGGPQLVRGFDGTLTTYSYAWSGTPGSSDFVTTITQGPESSSFPGTVAAGTQTVTKTNSAGKVWSTVTTDLQSGLTLDFATATAYQDGTPFPSTFSRPLSTTEQYAYDGQGRVTSHTDPLGIAQSFTLDALGRVTQSTRNGLTWNIAYNQNAPGRTVSTTDGTTTRTRTETTSPFGSNQSVSITGPENITVTRADNGSTITTQTTNSTTGQTSSESVTKGTLATAISGNATEPWNVTYSFPGAGWQQTTTHGSDSALTATTSFDALGRVSEQDTPSPSGSGTAATIYTYTGGRLSAAQDPTGTTQYAYQPDGSLGQVSRGARYVNVARAQADGSSIGWVWTDAAGETLWQRNYYPSSGGTKDLPWGESARTVTSTPSISGSVLSMGTTGPNGSGTASWQDGVPSSGSWTNGAVATGWMAGSNAFGDVTSQTVKPGNVAANALTTSFDAFSLPSGTTGLVATSRTNSFDGSGNLTSVLTRNNHTLMDKLSSEGDNLGTTGYGVPDAPWSAPSYGSTITRTLSSGAGNAQFTYNLAGALQRRQFPDGSAESFTYDGSGALASRTTPRASFSFVPNAFGQPTQIGGMGTLGYDGAGRVNSVSDAADTYTQTYSDGQPFVQTHTGGVLAGQSVERDCDSLGRLQTLRLPGGMSVGYTYNGPNGALSGVTTAGGASGTWTNFDAVMGVGKNFTLGPLSTVSVWDGLGRNTSQASTVGGSTSTYTHGYDADGHCNSANTPNGSWTYGFDGNGWLHTAQGSQNFTYNFDEAGRPANATDWRPTLRLNLDGVAIFGSVTPGATVQVINGTTTTPVPTNASTGQFSLSLTGVSSGWQTYTTRGTLAGAGTGGTNAVADAVNQVFVPPSSESLSYDASGNRGGDARWTQTWNSLDQMTSMVEANPASAATATEVDFAYDLQGRRVQKTVSVGGTVTKRTTTLWDGWKPVMQIDYTGAGGVETARRYYTWGPDVSGTLDGAAGIGGLLEIVERKGGAVTTSLPIYDGVGNVVGLVDGSSGQSVATYQYGPFGEVLGVYGARAASCPFRYQTRLYDDETGLSYYVERYYDAKARTWESRDPLREDGGVNLYAYCHNDPVTGHDPLGLADSIFELMFPAHAGRDDLVQVAREGGLYAGYGVIAAPARIAAIPKVQGSIRMAGGGLEVASGTLYSVGTGGFGGILGGGVLALNGADNFYAGLQTYRSNSYQPAFLERGITSVAGNGIVGNGLYAATQLGIGFAPAAGSRLLNFAQFRRLTSLDTSSLAGAPLGYQGGPGAMYIGEDIENIPIGGIDYGTLDALGRPTGVRATITQEMIGTGSPASRSIRPPGFQGGSEGQARGHLLGNQLGGSGSEIRNLVTLQQTPANTPVMRGIENQIRAAVEGGQVFEGSFTPIYLGNNLVPRAITIMGEGTDGFNIGISVLNPDGL